MAYSRPTYLRELMQLSKNAEQEFHGQVKLLHSDGLYVNTFTVEIVPERGLYAHASFSFLVTIPDHYPNAAPLVTCLTPIFHPNIEMTMSRDNVCLNIFRYWERHFGIKDLIHSLLFLLYEPNFDDPYNLYCSDLPMPVEECIRHTLAGGTINSVKFPPNKSWCRWASENGILPLTDEPVRPCVEELSNNFCVDQPTYNSEQPIEQLQPVANTYFRRSLSGQFTPGAQETSVIAWSHLSSTDRVLPLGFLSHITLETLNDANAPSLPWSNFKRYYFAELCHNIHAEFLWNVIDASIGFDHVDRIEQPASAMTQRSIVNLWLNPMDDETHALFTNELSSAEEFGNMLTELLLGARVELPDQPRGEDTGIWNLRESSWQGSESRSMLQIVPVEGESRTSESGHPSNFNVQIDSSLPSDSHEPGIAQSEVSSDAHSAPSLHSDVVNLVDPRNPIQSTAIARVNDGQDVRIVGLITQQSNPFTNQNTAQSDTVRSEANELEPIEPAIEEPSSMEIAHQYLLTLSHECVEDNGEHSTLPSGIEFPRTEYDGLPIELQLLLDEPTIDLSFPYPVVERYEISSSCIHPYQFFVFKRLLRTLQPFSWFCYQTRWPPFLAPGRGITLTPADFSLQTGECTRASSSQLLYDLLQYCRRHHGPYEYSLLLVDPLALSPWSPVLNHVVFKFPACTYPNIICVRSTYWVSFSDSVHQLLRPDLTFIRSHLCTFLLTSTCLLCNLVSYLSRLELYGTSLGYSRRTRLTVVDYMGSVCLLPATLGCGQCALLDGWLLWMATRGLRFLCSMLWIFASCAQSRTVSSPVRSLVRFPFSDVDEI